MGTNLKQREEAIALGSSTCAMAYCIFILKFEACNIANHKKRKDTITEMVNGTKEKLKFPKCVDLRIAELMSDKFVVVPKDVSDKSKEDSA